MEPFSYTPEGNKEFLLIDGVVSNSEAERGIRVQKGSGFEKLSFQGIAAVGSIWRDGEYWGDLLPGIQEGELIVPLEFVLESGREYSLHVQTQSGAHIQSRPQRLPLLLKADSLTYAVEREISFSETSGISFTERFVRIYSHINISGLTQAAYLLWYRDGVYTFQESIAPINTCYISYPVTENSISLLNTEGLQDLLQKRVASQTIDDRMKFEHMFNIYMHSISEDSYRYYESILRLNAREGALYDEVPGPLKGNIYQESGEEVVLLGNITFALVDTIRIKVRGENLGVDLFGRCDAVDPCGQFSQTCICADCLAAIPGASLRAPDYWDE